MVVVSLDSEADEVCADFAFITEAVVFELCGVDSDAFQFLMSAIGVIACDQAE